MKQYVVFAIEEFTNSTAKNGKEEFPCESVFVEGTILDDATGEGLFRKAKSSARVQHVIDKKLLELLSPGGQRGYRIAEVIRAIGNDFHDLSENRRRKNRIIIEAPK